MEIGRSCALIKYADDKNSKEEKDIEPDTRELQ